MTGMVSTLSETVRLDFDHIHPEGSHDVDRFSEYPDEFQTPSVAHPKGDHQHPRVSNCCIAH